MEFVAIDFETADYKRDSACSVGLVRIRNGQVIDEAVHLIRPPREEMLFTHIHGLRWEDVEHAPKFTELWPRIENFFQGIDFLAAHNAPFDKGVLRACCESSGIPAPQKPFICTVDLARKTWKLHPANLAAVCQALQIPLKHHEALSDARACAQIVVRASKELGDAAVFPIKSLSDPRKL